MINDPIADLLTRIRNANMRKHKTVTIPYSKLKQEILNIFLAEGYITDFKIIESKDSIEKNFKVTLKYSGNAKVITGLRRISKPGLRIYQEASKLPQVLNGFGVAVVSTNKGLMTDKDARTQNLGGEVMLFI
jgi:small subunit ribosomal protein S8